MDELLAKLIDLTPIPKKWAWLFDLVIGISSNFAVNYFISYALCSSAQYAEVFYSSISDTVKLSISVGLISLFFCIVLQPSEKLFSLIRRLFVLVIGISSDFAVNYSIFYANYSIFYASNSIFYALYSSAHYAGALYTSISGTVKLSIFVGLVSLYFCIVPQPWEELYLLYKIFRVIDDRVKEAIRDRFRMFLFYDIHLRFSSVPPMRIPWEVYNWLAMQREWQALPPMAIKYRYDPIDFKLKRSKGKATAKSSTLEGAESAQFASSDIKVGVAQFRALGNKDISFEECKPGDIRTNNYELENPMAAELRLNTAKTVTPESRDLSCNVSQSKDYRVIRLLKLSRWYPGGGIHAMLIEAHLESLPDYEAISYT
jgi:hypothetical protein